MQARPIGRGITSGALRYGQYTGGRYGGQEVLRPWSGTLFQQIPGNALAGWLQYAGPSNGGANITTYNGGAALLAPNPSMMESTVTAGMLVNGPGGVPNANQGAHAFHDVPALNPVTMDYSVSCTQSNNQSRIWLEFECAGLTTDQRGYVLEIALDGARTLGLFDLTFSAVTPLAVTAANTLPAGLDTPTNGPPVYYTAQVRINHVARTADCYFNGVKYLSAVGLRAASKSARWIGQGLQWLNGQYADQWSTGKLKVTAP